MVGQCAFFFNARGFGLTMFFCVVSSVTLRLIVNVRFEVRAGSIRLVLGLVFDRFGMLYIRLTNLFQSIIIVAGAALVDVALL